MTTIIDQADSIVGINPRATGLDEKTQERVRRGAYSEWFAKNSQPDMWPTVAEVLSSQAERIVRLHAASKPKGDGLPDDWQVRVVGTAACCVLVSPSNDAFGFVQSTADAVAKHLALCLTPPVRRLLAEFDVVEKKERGVSGWIVSTTKDGIGFCINGMENDAEGLEDAIEELPNHVVKVCWLVPKGAK